jgi:hypothetical protein
MELVGENKEKEQFVTTRRPWVEGGLNFTKKQECNNKENEYLTEEIQAEKDKGNTNAILQNSKPWQGAKIPLHPEADKDKVLRRSTSEQWQKRIKKGEPAIVKARLSISLRASLDHAHADPRKTPVDPQVSLADQVRLSRAFTKAKRSVCPPAPFFYLF